MNPHYLPIDSELVTLQDVLQRSMLALHTGAEDETWVWFWGKEYRVSVRDNRFTVELGQL